MHSCRVTVESTLSGGKGCEPKPTKTHGANARMWGCMSKWIFASSWCLAQPLFCGVIVAFMHARTPSRTQSTPTIVA